MVKTVFGGLVTVLGLQSMRFLFGSLTWYLRDTVGVGVLDLIPIALGPFLAGALLPILTRRLGVNPALWGGASLLAVARVINQVSSSPAVDLWAALVAVAAFVGLPPLLHAMGRPALVGGVLLGIVPQLVAIDFVGAQGLKVFSRVEQGLVVPGEVDRVSGIWDGLP